MSIVSGSHTVELRLYCGDVALQCNLIPMWCSEVCTVSTLTHVGLLCFSSAQAEQIALKLTYVRMVYL